MHRKRMADRQDHLVFVLLEQHRVESRQRRQPQKAAVHPPFADPALHLVIIAQQHFIPDAGIVLLQCGEDIRQPVDRHAGERPDADDARLDPVHPADLPLKLSVVVQDLPQKRQHLFSGRGQADAALAPLEKRHVPFRLQIRDHLATEDCA